jgi:hypothetical protein
VFATFGIVLHELKNGGIEPQKSVRKKGGREFPNANELKTAV